MTGARQWHKGWALVPAAAIFLYGCASPVGVHSGAENLHDTLQTLAQQHHVCAVGLSVIKNRKLDAIDSASGCTPAQALDANSVFQAASLGKPVFAYAVLKLVEQGQLTLDTPLLHYLPQGYRHRYQPLKAEPSDLVADPRINAVTARMVLTHTSGLPSSTMRPCYSS